MKIFLFLALTVLLGAAGMAQSSAGENRQTRAVSEFHGISVSSGINLYIQAGPPSVAVSASTADARDHIVTEVENGILKIHLEEGYTVNREGALLKAYVSLNTVRSLVASGGSDIYLQTAITTKHLEVNLSGGSNFKGKLSAEELFLRQSGGSDVDLSGSVSNISLNASGGSDLSGFDLVADNASIESSGGSNVHLTVNKELKVMSSGGSDVIYKGTAKVVEIKSSGSGRLVKKD